jgi:hypothetical protein
MQCGGSGWPAICNSMVAVGGDSTADTKTPKIDRHHRVRPSEPIINVYR